MSEIPFNETQTSKDAADSMKPVVKHLKSIVLEILEDLGDQGATADEIEAMGIPGNSLRPRLLRLEEQGKILRSGRTRPTRSGRNASVWTVRSAA